MIEHNEHGHPLCPICEEDELYTATCFYSALQAQVKQSNPVYQCYNCGWRGRTVGGKAKPGERV